MGRYWMKIFADEIRDMLNRNDMNYEAWSIDENTCEVWIMDGDWKHDHTRLKYLLSSIGYDWYVECDEDEVDDEDCYSAHYTVERGDA